MSNSANDKSSESSIPIPTNESNHAVKPANQLLQEFLTKNKLEIRLTPPVVRQVDGGGLMIDQPQIIVNYAQATPIPVAKKN